MNQLGKRLRELRVRNEMSQEDVARRIGVTVQAVSKWENGKSYPEIGSLIPLSDLFHVPVDELLDREKRRRDWENRLIDALADPDEDARMRFLKEAVLEFPGDPMFRYRLACEEYVQGWRETDAGRRRLLHTMADERFAALQKEFPELTVATDMRVRVLTALDRREEAAEQAKASPNRERLLLTVLDGEELEAQQRKVATTSLLNLLADLLRLGSPEALRMAESIVTDAAERDSRLMGFLLETYDQQALLCCERRRTEEAVAWLEKGCEALKSLGGPGGGERIAFLYPNLPLMQQKTKREYAAVFFTLLQDVRLACLREDPAFQRMKTAVRQMTEENDSQA